MPEHVKAVLGPTNTGKTHYAVERMLSHASGVMGFPLRLLAREVYDRVVSVKGSGAAALITGEERIVPERARYFLCTAEAMPRHSNADFVAVDEIQMAQDPERGHIFTEHLLHTRGKHETLFLGSETMRRVITNLIPDVEIMTRPRMSDLTCVKPAKLSRLPRRSAIVGFSASEVYGMAELLRRSRGGTAIVMGALSPRTRNAQVEMYQNGEVDFLVATDAIGMGLNMDIHHIAFAGLSKFDGRSFRDLTPAEAAQIAGRAGRYKRDGTFSTLSGGDPMDPMMAVQIEDHQFEPVKKLSWRNSRLDYQSLGRLIRSLEVRTNDPDLHRLREAGDVAALKALAQKDDISDRATTKETVEMLWQVAQIPDFRKLSDSEHHGLMARIFTDLTSSDGVISEDLMARQVKRLDNIHGDIDTLAGRIASIRVWTYVSHRSRWLKEAAHWAHVTRGVEDKLSDALHERLTQRFVDRRTAVLMRALKKRDDLSVSIDDESGKVAVEGHEIGDIQGFSFKVEAGAARDDQKTLKAAAETALQGEILRRAKLFANIGVKTLEIDFEKGLANPRLLFEGAPFAVIQDSGALMAPRIKLVDGTLLDGEAADIVRTAAQNWLDARVSEKLDPLMRLAQELNGEITPPEDAVPLSGTVRGVAYRLLENYGVLRRAEVAAELKDIDQEQRKALRRFGIRIGANSLYIPFVLKPHATELRMMFWAQRLGDAANSLPSIPTPGMVWCERDTAAPAEFYALAGFVEAGTKAVRMDMLERLADAVRPLGQNRDWFEVTPEIMGLVGLSGDDFCAVMTVAGYENELRQVPPPSAAQPASEATEESDSTSQGSEPESEAGPVQSEAEADAEAKTEAAAPGPVKDDADTQAEAKDTPSESPADAPTTDSASSDSAAEPASETPSGGEQSDEALVDRHFFRWSPRRGGGRGGERRGNKGRDGGGDRRHKPDGRGRGGAKGQGRPGGKGGKGEKGGNQAGRGGSKPRQNKPLDPDSPFAALAGLKDQLKKK